MCHLAVEAAWDLVSGSGYLAARRVELGVGWVQRRVSKMARRMERFSMGGN